MIRDPGTNGGRSLAMLQEHMATDHLVAWGWNAGPGREPPPLDKPAFDGQVSLWIRNGAPCDSNEALQKWIRQDTRRCRSGHSNDLRLLATHESFR